MMPAYFSAERAQELLAGKGGVHQHFRELRDKMCMRAYKTERGAEYAKHGFCRRLETLVRSIDRVYELLPPDQDAIPERDVVVDAAIAIQAFTMNAFGCLDNIAWIWVYEKGIKNGDGTELQRKHVGLRKPRVHNKLTKDFQAYLATKQEWFDNLVAFRDSLAHRIPLYIPPFAAARSAQRPWTMGHQLGCVEISLTRESQRERSENWNK
jgi:hypothetical protein